MILPGRAAVLAVLLIALVLIVRAAFRRDRVLGWLVTAAAVTYVLAALLMGVYLEQVRGRDYLAPDEVAFQREGALIVEGWKSGEPHVPAVAGGYPFWNAVLIFFWGPSPLVMRLANAVAGTATVLFAFVLASHLFKDRLTARIGAAFVMASPSLMIWGAQNMKERPLGLFVIMAVVAAVTLLERWNWRRVALFAASLVLLGELRHYYAAIIGWITIMAVAVWPSWTWRDRLPRLGALVLAVGLALQVVTGTFLASGMRYETVMRYVRLSDGRAEKIRPGYRIGETGGRAEAAGDRTLGGWARSAGFVLFGRFEPLGGTGAVMAVALAPEWLLSFLLLPLAIVAVWGALRERDWLIVVPAGFTIAMLLLLTYIHGEPWTTIRFRSVYWPVFLVLASGGVVLVLRAQGLQLANRGTTPCASRVGLD
jgi:hypothetical protein